MLATGAAGGVGSVVTQISKWRGARTIGADRTPMSPEVEKAYGIDHYSVLESTNGSNRLVEGALAATDHKGVDVVYDCVGGPLFETCLKTLGQLGRQINITSVGDRRVFLRSARFLPSSA